jgi:two-component system response regulator
MIIIKKTMNTPIKNPEFTILMVDDDRDDQEFVTIAVNMYSPDIKVECVNNGFEAIDFLNSEVEPDLIILDLNMPRKNGKEVLNYIKSEDVLKHIPVVIYTTSNSPEDVNETYKLGANSFLSKPKHFNDVITSINLICSYWHKTISLPKGRTVSDLK